MLERVRKNVVDHSLGVRRVAEVWNTHCEWVVAGQVDMPRLRAAVTATMREHPMLAARDGGDGKWVLGQGRPSAPVALRAVPTEEAAMAARAAAVSRPFDLRSEAPVRFEILRAPEHDHVVAVADHAVVDGVGIGRTVASVLRNYVADVTAPIDEAWRRAHSLDVPGSSAASIDAIARHLGEQAVPTTVRLAREHVTTEPGQGVAYHELSMAATEALHAVRRAQAGTRNDAVVAAFCLAGMSWNRALGSAMVPFSVGVPVNLRPVRAWLDGVCNATLPWSVRIDSDDPADVLAAVVAQVRVVRAGAYSPAVRAALGYIDRHDGRLPLRVRLALATSTVVSTVPGADEIMFNRQVRGLVAGVQGGAPVPESMGMTFAVVPRSCRWQLSARFLLSHHTTRGACRFLSLVDDAVVRLAQDLLVRMAPA